MCRTRTWIGLLPRIYSAYSGIHYGRFYAHGDLPDTEPPRRASEYQAFRFRFQLVENDLNSPSTRSLDWLWLLSDNEKQNKAPFHRSRPSINARKIAMREFPYRNGSFRSYLFSSRLPREIGSRHAMKFHSRHSSKRRAGLRCEWNVIIDSACE